MYVVETSQGYSRCVFIHESSVIRDLDVCHICLHWRQCRVVPSESFQSVWVAYWRSHWWPVSYQQLYNFQ